MMTEQERQDIRDLLAAAKRIGGEELRLAVWRQIPHHIRMRFNYEQTRDASLPGENE